MPRNKILYTISTSEIINQLTHRFTFGYLIIFVLWKNYTKYLLLQRKFNRYYFISLSYAKLSATQEKENGKWTMSTLGNTNDQTTITTWKFLNDDTWICLTKQKLLFLIIKFTISILSNKWLFLMISTWLIWLICLPTYLHRSL